MALTTENTQIEEPPGRAALSSIEDKVLPYTINKITLPVNADAKLSFLRGYALFIHNAYTKTPVESISEIPEHKREIAVLGMLDAEQIIEVREGEVLVGLLAYTAYNREQHPNVFQALSRANENITRREARLKFEEADKQIGRVIHIAELAVRKDKRGNGVSPEMRRAMVEDFPGELILEIGEIQSASPLKQREKLGLTYFAGEVFNENKESLPQGLSIDDFGAYCHTKGNMYVDQVEKAGYDSYGIIASTLFEFPAAMPERLLLSSEEKRAMQRIIDRQLQTGEICSAVAVTLYRV